ncbi:hypothetical protein E1B28_010679 [Marasmius oreades]|uniref:Uncharacterized protein n=1 Tax=Marasmius oreades TaxID=181124 RepID=A0A9P7RY83_9AGAR|nr:uncharacterized protein E1B28_010679 [Marasmius oreades]KAG7091658.1 hypothetical protein E1B28_010679 [Marasmius oreades]
MSCDYDVNFDQACYFDQQKEKLQVHANSLATILRKVNIKTGLAEGTTRRKVEEMMRDIAETIVWIDDVHSYAMLGGLELQSAYEERRLFFTGGSRV